jgi:hypothetical protein
MNEPLVTDERPVERALREILEPLDRQFARVTAFLPLGLVTILPGVFFASWLGLDFSIRRSLIVAGGAFCVLVAIYLAWEIAVARLARRRFDRRFPSGTPQRSAALHMLFEMESPSRAEDKLRVALGSSSPDRIVRRRPANEVPVAWPPSSSEGVPPQVADLQPTPRPGGYYDYIPLEPRPGDADRPGERTG